MGRSILEQRLQNCKVCGKQTIHTRSKTVMTAASIIGLFILSCLTGGIYLIFWAFSAMFNSGGVWCCEKCLDNPDAPKSTPVIDSIKRIAIAVLLFPVILILFSLIK